MTKHEIIIGASDRMNRIEDNSIHLVVTSPPYPMVEMWDDIMSSQNPDIKVALESNRPYDAFELIHVELDKVWKEVERVLIPGGFACINIGDATRSVNGNFALYSNHSRIISAFEKLSFNNLPGIIWRKQTNAPNKFMGSGMLPAGAYVTLEHEWILIFRKGEKRVFKPYFDDWIRRKESSYFWEERNVWFSNFWDLKGVKQKMDSPDTRKRSAAYPFEIPYRLINMYSSQGDYVLDPFLGTGTTMLAAIASNRNSFGYEIDESFFDVIVKNIESTPIYYYNSFISKRLIDHNAFVLEKESDPDKSNMKHFNTEINTPVMTNQEIRMCPRFVADISRRINLFEVLYCGL